MIRLFITLVVGALFLVGLPLEAVPLDPVSKDEAAIAAHIKALHDVKSEVRSAAAEALRGLVAKHPSRTVYLRSKDGGETYWTEKVNQVKPGMTRAQVLKILPHFPEAPGASNMGSGQRNWDHYRLDYHWDVSVVYDNGEGRKGDREDKVSRVPTLTRRALRIHVELPKKYTGPWTTWYVNGQKGYEVHYQDGKYNGAHTAFHDNGQKMDQYHYKNHVADGAHSGWHRDGKKYYTGQYRNGKEDGRWLRWHANGQKQSEATYIDGKYDGTYAHWHENGQITSFNVYISGVKHGPEIAWNEEGVLQYNRLYQNGTIVDP